MSAATLAAPGGGGAAAPAGQAYLSGLPLVLATVVLGLGSFVNILDMSIANVSIPTIAGDLGVSYTQGTWVITSYAVSEAIMMPLTGWLAQRFGQVRLFVMATLLFTLASVLCGIAPNFPVLIAARVLQGVFGASMVPLSQSLLTSLYPPHRRGVALGLWSMTTVLAPIVGPLTGGWLTEALSWHWVFLINLPFGLCVALASWNLLRHRETPRRKTPVDYVGLALLAVGVGALQIVLDKGNELDWFNSGEVIALGCVSFVAIAFFIAWELTDAHPVVELRLFGRRNFLVGSICMLLGSMAFFGTVVLIPLWLQTFQGYTSLWAAKVVSFGGVFALMLGPVVGANIHRVDARAVATFGFIVFALVAFWSSGFTPDVDYWTVALSRLMMGIGISCFFLPIITINLSGLHPSQIASASGLSSFMRNLGSSFGTAIMVSLWDHEATVHHADMVAHVTDFDPAAIDYLASLRAAGLSAEQALAALDNTIRGQAFLMATDDVLFVSGVVLLCLIIPIWLARPPFTVRAGGGH
ncbi:DHA2 family efflux MFS transporter permease subunit [Azoarcus sp. L1K30]|uniref:DHA2 family efflux MFS transporter permease subunit n=1 Tax=Azoarcus sp. L1K30 TaxID=2820277 RepID=UPI001B83FE90|nr:DHA2 family efflux MFS transporter permease subunit [Azoarcus sp. L1K30]MBR0565959.1 DHA2 family efflux MFS transporter permease subunit [Azoarcus sp. L1K30]